MTEQSIRPGRTGFSHEELDRHKRRLAAAVTAQFPPEAIRIHSLSNLRRWRQSGAWVSAYAEWEDILTSGDNGRMLAAMLGQDEHANRLRQSPPYVGLLPREVLMKLNKEAAIGALGTD